MASYAKSAKISINPLHPDKVGGLKPVARLSLQNQWTVAILGVNLGTVFIIIQILGVGSAVWIGALAAVVYVIVAPIVFVGPLIPFRPHLLRGKADYLQKIADQFKDDLDAVLGRLRQDQASIRKLEKLDRLSRIHERISRLPEWPLDMATIRHFGAALLTPGVSILISLLLKKVLKGGNG